MMRRTWYTKKLIWGLLSVLLVTTRLYAQTSAQIYIIAVDWTDDGSKIAGVGIDINGEGGYIAVIDVNTSEVIFEQNTSYGGGFASTAWSPDGRFLAIGGQDQDVHIIDILTQETTAILSGHRWIVDSVDWNTDGTRLVSSSSSAQQVFLWDMSTHTLISAIEIGDPWGVDFGNDNRIAVGGFGLFVFPSYLDVGDPQNRIPLRYADAYIGSLRWNRDNSRIAFGTQTPTANVSTVNILDVSTKELIRTIQTSEEGIYGIHWSMDSSLIVTQSLSGNIHIWNADSGNLESTFLSIPNIIGDPDFSPYGGRLAYGTAFSPDALTRDNAFANSGIAIVVPVPSIERLNTIAQFCGALTADAPPVTTDTLNDWLSELDSPTRAVAVPPGCVADLQAIAEALPS